MSPSLPVVALTGLGVLSTVLGLAAPAIEFVVIGLVSIAVAGLLQVMGQRRSS
ncbi:MAG: hypothetical protein ABI598_05975 [Chloroflexota bacterium]